MTHYPVFFSIERPQRFDRGQLGLRILFLALLSVFGFTMGGVLALVYLVLPVLAAIELRTKGSSRFLDEEVPRFSQGLRVVMATFAYVALLTDRLPEGEIDDGVHFSIEPGAWHAPVRPTVSTALLRVFTSLPSAIVLALLAIPAWIAWFVAAILILFTETCPAALHDFLCGVLRWQARLLAYHACLVEAYPPFAFDGGSVPRAEHESMAH